ncbi:MAG: hypothetical protein NC033_05930 [Clostridiales bacterium]|nr:hypothetical protein [Clostridiales bacterium]
MLYILECMALGILCMYGGTDRIMSTTGEQPTWKEVGVCLLSWIIVFLVILFIVDLIKYILSKKKKLDDRNDFVLGVLYILECMALGILCMHGGTDRKMYTTGNRATGKEVVYCLVGWLFVVLIIISISLILFC